MILRFISLALLLLALLVPTLPWPSERKFVLFLLDESASVSPAARSGAKAFVRRALRGKGNHQAAFLAFADEPGPLSNHWFEAVETDAAHSDLAGAVRLAAAAVPEGRVPHLVLLSDGRQTKGELRRAAQAGVPIWTVPLAPFTAPEICLAAVHAPRNVRPRQSIAVDVKVEGNLAGSGEIELRVDGRVVETAGIALSAEGKAAHRFQCDLGASLPVLIEAHVRGFADTIRQNNRRSTWALPEPARHACVVTPSEDFASRLEKALAEHNGKFDVFAVSDSPGSSEGYSQFHTVFLADAPAASFTREQLAAIAEHVEGGGGLFVVGGEEVFAPPAYEDTLLEKILPVEAASHPAPRKTRLALALLIDVSNSMGEQRRLELAKQAAKQSLELLKPDDLAGLMTFANTSRWVRPIRPYTDVGELAGDIEMIQAAGRTNMAPALRKAMLALEQADVSARHAIVLTDGVSIPADFREIAEQMAEADIKVSTVSIGEGADRSILQEISSVTNGSHFHCRGAAELPHTLMRVAERAATSAARPLIVLHRLPGLEAESAPPLLGAVAVNPKADVELLLLSSDGDPLLSWWRHGDGLAAAMPVSTRDLARSTWTSWPGYEPFWRRLARHVAAQPSPAGELQLERQGEHCVATLTTGLHSREPAALQVTWSSGSRFSLPMQRTAPRRWSVRFPLTEHGAFHANARWGEQQAAARLAFDYPDEFAYGRADEDLLQEVAALTGGAHRPQAEDVFTADGRRGNERVVVWPWLILGAVLLFVVEAVTRRMA